MWLVRIALRRPFTVLVLAGAVLLSAFLSMRRAPVDIFPDLRVPVVYVVQPFAGMSPTQMESQIVTYYEYHFLYVSGIEHIESESIQGMSMLKLYFHPGTDLAQSMAQVVSMAFRATSFMPPGTLPAFIVRFDAGSIPVGQLVFSSPTRSDADIQDAALYKVRPMLATIPGVSAPPPSGGKVKTIVVYVDPEKLQEYRMAPDDVAQTLAKANLTLPAGNVRIDGKTLITSTNAMVQKVSDLENIPLRTGNGPTVFVRDIGRVEDGGDIVYNIAHVDGHRTVYMPVTKRADASTLDVIEGVKESLPKMRSVVPPDVKIDLAFDQSVSVRGAIRGLAIEGALGAVLTALLVLVFLRSGRSALIVVVTIPFSLLAAFVGLRLADQTVNIMSLGGLALAVGVLVDQASVAVENIHTHLDRNKPPALAVFDAMGEVMLPNFLAMLCVLAVFIPALFMVGIGRALFPPLALAVAFSMVASYVLTATLVPVLAIWLLRVKHAAPAPAVSTSTTLAVQPARDEATVVAPAPAQTLPTGEAAPEQHVEPTRWRAVYARALAPTMRARVLWVPVFLAISIAAAATGLKLGTELFPRVDAGQFQVRVRAPDGTQLERTEDIVRDVDRAVRDVAGTDNVEITLANIGNPAWTFPVSAIFVWNSGPSEALLLVSLKNNGHRASITDIEEKLRERMAKEHPETRFSFEAGDIVSQVLNFGAPTPILVNVSGNNVAETRPFAEKVLAEMKKIPSLRDVQIPQSLDYPTLNVQIDRERAAQLGVTVDRVGKSIVDATSSSSLVTPNFWVNPTSGVPYRVALRVPENQLQSAEDLMKLPIMPDGAPRPNLADVANVIPGKTFGEVDHVNSQRTISIEANLAERDLGGAAHAVEEAIARAGTPPRGASVSIRGQAEQMSLTLASLREGLLLAIIVVLLLLIANFQSVRDALLVVATLPAVIGGVAAALWITGSTLNVQSLMGAIMAIGVSVSNALLLVTFLRARRREGAAPMAAAMGAAEARLRPILMTSLAMIVGMIPMALGLGEGGEQSAPLGRAVIGGLAASLLATLTFVPALSVLIAQKTTRSASLDPTDTESPHYVGDRS